MKISETLFRSAHIRLIRVPSRPILVFAMPADDSPPLLEVRSVTKRYSGVLALREVDLSIRAGEVHALIGENGAGKSTLMKILAGIEQPTSGQIFLEGKAGHDRLGPYGPRPGDLDDPPGAESGG